MQRILLAIVLLGMTACYVTPLHGCYYAPRRVVVVHAHHYRR
jgi:hypothetical protein